MAPRPCHAARVLLPLLVLVALATPARPQAIEPIRYTLRVSAPHTHYVEVEATVPTAGATEIELMMAVWTPGSYLVREYSRQVEGVGARSPDGRPLSVTKTAKNRWRVRTGTAPQAVVNYRVYARELTVRTNFVDSRFAMLNGAPTFLTLAERSPRPHEVRLELPPSWKTSMTGLADLPGVPHGYRAPDFDTLVDSPILAGNPTVHRFVVDGVPHYLVNEGEAGVFDGVRAAQDVERIVRQTREMWGSLPYEKYVFLNVLAEAGGGLEHRNSVLMGASRWSTRTRQRYLGWLGLVSHEYFHLWNVKRLRPVELGPFDYEEENYTKSLWIAEGFTSYYGDLLVHRAGLSTRDEYLDGLSRTIAALQTTPGRLVQSAEISSFDTWIKQYRPDENSINTAISYYTKGEVIALLLDAKIRRVTAGAKSLDDMMRLAYGRYGGERGYSPAEFRQVAQDVAGVDLSAWFTQALESTDELDYGEALDWFGLRFRPAPEPTPGQPGRAWLGLRTRVDGGRLLVSQVVRGTPGYEAGFNVDDEILAIDQFRVPADRWNAMMDVIRPGQTAMVLVARRDELLRLDTTFGREPESLWRLEVPPAASADQQSRLAAWLGRYGDPAMTIGLTPTSAADAVERPEATLAPGHGFGTAPVFLASISTILGAVLFLRFAYGVAHAGVLGALAIVLLGHMVTVPTALAIAEIATNRRVEGGGEYFIISRSFGTTIGASIGVALYLSQAISVAFYMIAFAESVRPLVPWFEQTTGLTFDPRMVSLPGTVVLALLVLLRGANLGVKALWVVVALLAMSLVLFFMGSDVDGGRLTEVGLIDRVAGHDPFMLVFAIVFPAFTGMTAGVGLSGDLKNPRRSIPLGILTATVTGMVVYVAVIFKLAASASPADLAADQLIMARIAVWGPMIPIGLAAATVSSAIGSILVAPRTLQALGSDGIAPWRQANAFFARGHGTANEPRNATLVTATIAMATVSLGSVNFVARIISMFFMVTYGALCAISFLEYMAARPSYRPSFRSKWYLSLLGALMSLFLMFQMDPFYAILAILIMFGVYRGIRAAAGGGDDLAAIFRGVMTQITRHFQIRLQQSARGEAADDWRPSVIAVNGRTFERSAHLQFLNWLCSRYAFGTYLHFIPGRLDEDTYRESRRTLGQLIRASQSLQSTLFVDTIVSPSVRSALAQSLQVPGVTGIENNTILFELSELDSDEVVHEAYEGCLMAHAARMNSLVLRHGSHFFGARATLHVWLTWHDYKNADLMILLVYILLGHPDWRDADIRIFAAFPREEVDEQRARLRELIATGRLAISEKNLRVIATDDRTNFERLVQVLSASADLVLFGFTDARLQEKGPQLFLRHQGLRDVLFVSAEQRVRIE